MLADSKMEFSWNIYSLVRNPVLYRSEVLDANISPQNKNETIKVSSDTRQVSDTTTVWQADGGRAAARGMTEGSHQTWLGQGRKMDNN